MLVEKFDTFSGHRDCVYALEKGNSHNQFFSSGGDGLVVRWNVNQPDTGELFAKIPTSVYALAFDEKRNHLWIGQNFDGIQVLDIMNKKEIGLQLYTLREELPKDVKGTLEKVANGLNISLSELFDFNKK